MDPIQEAIEGIESREDGASLLYLEVAKKSGLIDRRCREGNEENSAQMQPTTRIKCYSTHNRSMNLCYT
jgi:hypothetical protein